MNIKCAFIASGTKPKGLPLCTTFANGCALYLNTDQASFVLDMGGGRTIYIFGELFYAWAKATNKIKKITSVAQVKQIFNGKSLLDIIPSLEGQYIGVEVNRSKQEVRFFSDRYAREDSFYTQEGKDLYLASSLDFIFEHLRPQYDQLMLAHLFAVYGWYTPKGKTIYKNVAQLKVGEVLTVAANSISAAHIPFKPLVIDEETKLEDYYSALSDSIEARLPNDKRDVWVSSSSGWDSSIILGMLVDKIGPKRVNMMTGSMQYSGNTGLINRFEINKINSIGHFYGIKPRTVNLDFKNKSAIAFWKSIVPQLKATQMYTLTGFNFARIAQGIANADGQEQIVFNGETSDSFHNFGFSQFATFFHSVKSFTEYGDKMNCYLYGPTFFQKVLDGDYAKDKVYQIFNKMMPSVNFETQWPNQKKQIESYLLPLFYGGPRIPFARTMDNPMIRSKSTQGVATFTYGENIPELLKTIKPENMYSWFIHMYSILHSQGSTVGIHKHAMHLTGHHWRSPFYDSRMMDVLSRAPESWGRGLDFNHTKYPLKWVAKNKIKFPYALLEQGPHSYLYDVIEGFSLLAEITYRSGFTGYFKDTLKTRSYKKILSDEYFDHEYMDALVDGYLQDKEIKGQDFNNLFSLITLTTVGWY